MIETKIHSTNTATAAGYKTVSILKQSVSRMTRFSQESRIFQAVLMLAILAGQVLLLPGSALAAGGDASGSDPFAFTVAPWVSNMFLFAVVVAALSCAVYYVHNLLTTVEDQ